MKRLTLAIGVLTVLAACAKEDERIRFDGQVFRTKAAKVADDLAEFSVTVSPVSASEAGAREAAKYEAVRYCIANYGTSKIDWAVSPEAETILIDSDTATFQGRCNP